MLQWTSIGCAIILSFVGITQLLDTVIPRIAGMYLSNKM